MGFGDPQVKTCGYPRLAPPGPDRKLLILAPMGVRGLFAGDALEFCHTRDFDGPLETW